MSFDLKRLIPYETPRMLDLDAHGILLFGAAWLRTLDRMGYIGGQEAGKTGLNSARV